MKFKTLSNEGALDLLGKLKSDPHHPAEDCETAAGAGEPLGDDLPHRLRKELSDLFADAADDKTYDARACVVVHEMLPRDEELLSNDSFWRWIALGPLREVVLRRFGATKVWDEEGDSPSIHPQNFGVGSSARQRAECYPYKLWLRAELAFVDEGDSYRYARRGDVDFWTSHVHRQSYTTNRALCSALIRYQFPDQLEGKPRLHSGMEDPGKGKLGVRTLAKRIRALQATYELTLLSEPELDELIAEQAKGLVHTN